MRKLIDGILEFRRDVLPGYREMFARLALNQAPDCLFVACSDSRVVPNLFASSDPGDLFVVRNVGNLVPPSDQAGVNHTDRSAAAAMEFALSALEVDDIIVCGHSECGAMKTIANGLVQSDAPNLDAWLQYGRPALETLRRDGPKDDGLPLHDQVSQLNVLEQIEHLLSFPMVQERVDGGKLRLHGWWFDIGQATVYLYDERVDRFMPIHEYDAGQAAELSVGGRSRNTR